MSNICPLTHRVTLLYSTVLFNLEPYLPSPIPLHIFVIPSPILSFLSHHYIDMFPYFFFDSCFSTRPPLPKPPIIRVCLCLLRRWTSGQVSMFIFHSIPTLFYGLPFLCLIQVSHIVSLNHLTAACEFLFLSSHILLYLQLSLTLFPPVLTSLLTSLSSSSTFILVRARRTLPLSSTYKVALCQISMPADVKILVSLSHT